MQYLVFSVGGLVESIHVLRTRFSCVLDIGASIPDVA